MNWNKVTPELEKKICEMYATKRISCIREETHINEKRIREILKKNNVQIRNPRKSMTKEGEWDYQTECQKRYPKHEGLHYVARSKDGKVEYDDFMNTSGILTSYISKVYNVKPDSLFKRKKYFKEHGRQWYEDYFDIIEVSDVEVEYKHCPYCEWKTTDINNRSGAFLNHLLYEHDMKKEDYLGDHPEDTELFTVYANPTKTLQYEADETKYVVCSICGRKLARIDQKHLRSHGITLSEYNEMYTGGTVCNELHEKMSALAIETNKNMTFHNRSKAELEIEQFILDNGVSVNGKRKMVEGNEIDVYLPELKIGIEYNGIYYHTEEFGKGKDYHLNKTEVCKRNGIRLIHVFEDEFTLHKDIVMNKIGHIIGIDQHKPKVMARKCSLREINNREAEVFVNKYHIQGFVSSSVYLGAYFNDLLVAVMTFKKEGGDDNEWELNRFCSDYNYVCQGIGGRLFKYFIKNYKPKRVKSFADRRWTLNEENNLYIKLGFSFDSYTKPDYRYVGKGVLSHVRSHKFNFRKDRLLAMDRDKLLTPDMTEDQMRKILGLKRIWDCGLIKYIWKEKSFES